MNTKKMGWLPDPLDFRDYRYAAIMPPWAFTAEALPSKADIRDKLTPIRDQGNLGACTGFGTAAAMEALDPSPTTILSPLFIYYRARAMEGTVPIDAGAYIRDCVKSCVVKGVCHEKCWPYDISKFAVTPHGGCYWQAKHHQILSYHRIDTLIEMKACLASGYGFIFGYAIYESMFSQETMSTGIIRMPKQSEEYGGGHCVFACGYDDDSKLITIRNSWGTACGDKGYFYMPYDYVRSRNLSDDFWTIRRVELDALVTRSSAVC